MRMNAVWQVCLLGLLPVIVPAAVYEWVDQNGRSHYSDRQHEHARQLKIDPGIMYYRVERVVDGDTIFLSDGRRIRLLGINTPEVSGRNKSAEAGGDRAKEWLQQAVDGKKVSLQFDVEKADKYQRTLAYVFTDSKRHINLELVERGLATVNIYPPNFKYLEALVKAQTIAESQKLGIWAEAAYAPVEFATINEVNYKGWKRLTGRVVALKQSEKYSYLQFSANFSLKIDNQWLSLFPDLKTYTGKQLEVRGWLNKRNQQFSLHLRHPADIKILD